MIVFEKPKALTDAVLHYCPGCTHGIIHRLVAEAIDDLGIQGSAPLWHIIILMLIWFRRLTVVPLRLQQA